MITTTITTLADGHACYTITADLDGGGRRIVYVGACPMAQLAMLPDAHRHSEWQRLIMRNTAITLTICSLFDSADQASDMAAALVIGLRPWINLNGTITVAHARNRRALLCSDGRMFDSGATAAEALGVTASAVSKHLKGGLTTVAGVTLTRTI